jgi:hypothetical protein
VAGIRRWHFWWPGRLDASMAARAAYLHLDDRHRLHRVGTAAKVADTAAAARDHTGEGR